MTHHDTHHTVDGCEILHQLIDGKHPIIYDKHPIIYRLLSILFGGAGFCNRPQYLHDSFKLNSPRRCWIPWLMDFLRVPKTPPNMRRGQNMVYASSSSIPYNGNPYNAYRSPLTDWRPSLNMACSNPTLDYSWIFHDVSPCPN